MKLPDDVGSSIRVGRSCWMWRGRILDGRNRYAACEKAGVKPAFVNYAGKDPQGYALAVNKHRRHMRPSALQLITEEVRRLMVGKQSHITQTKRKAIAIMRRSCSDSLLTASQVDGVFGSDNRCRGRKCGRNVGFWVYTVGVPDVEMEIPE
jgi:hypothetical protein